MESNQTLVTCVGECPRALKEVVGEAIGKIADEAILAVAVVTIVVAALNVWRSRRKDP